MTASHSARRDSIDRHVDLWRKELPSLNPRHEAIIARLMRVSRHLTSARKRAFDEDDLPPASFKILLALRRLGPPYTASPSELADSLGLSRGALSARLAPLEDDGLISRALDRQDRRRVHVRLTSAGSQVFDAHAHREGADEAALLDVLSATEQKQLSDLLRILLVAIEDDPD